MEKKIGFCTMLTQLLAQGCGGYRSPRAQKFTWNADGTPDFGIPVKAGKSLRIPSNKKRKHN
jgi:hypothetical protein